MLTKKRILFVMSEVLILMALMPNVRAIGVDVMNEYTKQEVNLQKEWVKESSVRDAALMTVKKTEERMNEIHRMAVEVRKKMCAAGNESKCPPKTLSLYITSYNAEVAQTDSTPCGGAGGDVCEMTKKGHRVIALSRDLIPEHFKMGDTIYLKSAIAQCNGKFLVFDTMGPQWSMMGDLFFLSRKDNTSCHAIASDRPLTN